jgi:hypothetical protein
MPTDLKDLQLDEVSLVGSPANNRKFLIFKSMQKSKGSMKMTDHKPAGAKAGAGEAQVTKADLEGMIEKAISGVREENVKLKKALQTEKGIRRQAELERIAKADYAELGDTSETAKILKSLEDSNLPDEVQKGLKDALKQANAVKKEAMKTLGSTLGSSRPAPGSAIAQFDALVETRMGEIRKSADAPKDQKVLKALATQAVTKENGKLAQAVLAEQREASMRAQMGVS